MYPPGVHKLRKGRNNNGYFQQAFGKGADTIGAPVAGEAVEIQQVSDPTFGQEILGKGIAIKPSEGRVVAPCDGTVDMMFDTGHAVSLVADFGAEILIHVGLDTVNLKGKHYHVYAKNGDKVKKGDLLMEFDPEAIKAEGYDIITPVIVCNSGDYTVFSPMWGKL